MAMPEPASPASWLDRTSARRASCIMSASMWLRSTAAETLASCRAPSNRVVDHRPAPALAVHSTMTAAPAPITLWLIVRSIPNPCVRLAPITFGQWG
jgi:hypothetical protein